MGKNLNTPSLQAAIEEYGLEVVTSHPGIEELIELGYQDETGLVDVPLPDWLQPLFDEIVEHSKKLYAYWIISPEAGHASFVCKMAIEQIAIDGRNDPVTRYLISREVERSIEAIDSFLKVQKSSGKAELISAFIEDESKLKLPNKVLQRKHKVGASTVRDAKKAAKAYLKGRQRMLGAK